MAKKTKRKTLIEDCDRLWRQCVRARDRCCRVCGRDSGKLDAHHIIKRRHMATRWDLLNGCLLCFSHHRAEGHDNPVQMYKNLVEIFGEEELERLRVKSLKIVKFSINELTQIKYSLAQELKRIQP